MAFRDGFKVQRIGVRRFKAAIDRAHKRTLRAANKGVSESSAALQKEIRREVDRIFSGASGFRRRKKSRRVSGAIRRKVYDNKERGSAALIFNKFGRREHGRFIDYLGPYLTGRDITPRRGRAMAIPLQPGKKNRDPKNFPNLVAIKIAGRIYLVRHTRTRSLFMFMLLPRVRVRHRLRVRQTIKAEARRLGIRVRRNFGKV